MSLPKITRENNSLYLTQDISGYGEYDRAKAIVNFCDKETKLFEKEIDRVISEILEQNRINIPNTDKKVLKLAFDLLKAKGKDIEIVDLYDYGEEQPNSIEYKVIKKTRNHLTVVLEENTLQLGVEIKEIKL